MLIIYTIKLKFKCMIKNYTIDEKFIRQIINLYIKIKNLIFLKGFAAI